MLISRGQKMWEDLWEKQRPDEPEPGAFHWIQRRLRTEHEPIAAAEAAADAAEDEEGEQKSTIIRTTIILYIHIII